jgi:hypothetical protein
MGGIETENSTVNQTLKSTMERLVSDVHLMKQIGDLILDLSRTYNDAEKQYLSVIDEVKIVSQSHIPSVAAKGLEDLEVIQFAIDRMIARRKKMHQVIFNAAQILA